MEMGALLLVQATDCAVVALKIPEPFLMRAWYGAGVLTSD
jgi:hypothetical protein